MKHLNLSLYLVILSILIFPAQAEIIPCPNEKGNERLMGRSIYVISSTNKEYPFEMPPYLSIEQVLEALKNPPQVRVESRGRDKDLVCTYTYYIYPDYSNFFELKATTNKSCSVVNNTFNCAD